MVPAIWSVSRWLRAIASWCFCMRKMIIDRLILASFEREVLTTGYQASMHQTGTVGGTKSNTYTSPLFLATLTNFSVIAIAVRDA